MVYTQQNTLTDNTQDMCRIASGKEEKQRAEQGRQRGTDGGKEKVLITLKKQVWAA